VSEDQVEQDRLQALGALDVLDSPPEAEFDLLTDLAARLFRAPVADLSLIAADRQWLKSRCGGDRCETAREFAFCSHTIQGDDLFEVTNALEDPRFAENPLVAGPPGIRYYAGVPLKLSSGHRVGALCIIDFAPRPPLAPAEAALLKRLCKIATLALESRQLRLVGYMSAAIAGTTPDAIICTDALGFITLWNPAAERMFGYQAAEAIDRPIEIIVPKEHRAAHNSAFARMMRTGERKLGARTVELPALRRDGSRFPVELSLAQWSNADGEIGGVGATIRDISDKKALEAEKDNAQRFLEAVVEHLPGMLFVKDAATREYLLWNRAGEEATGLQRSEVLGRTDGELYGEAGEDYMKRDCETLRTGIVRSFESRFERADGERRILRTRRVAVPDESGDARYLIGFSEDVTEWREAQDRLVFLAGHDPLTHLKNRVSFTERLELALGRAETLAVLAIDLDRLKAVNDIHGHHVGDALLRAFAAVIREMTGEGDVAARLAGDEFSLLLRGPAAETRAARVAEGLLERLREPLDLGTVSMVASASIGVAVAPDHGQSAEEILANADVALYRAKRDGRGRFRFFDSRMDQIARDRRQIEKLLREAVAEEAITLHFQPLAETETGQVVAFEALARWTHPELGEIRPDVFIPIAEESGLIGALGSHVLRLAVAEASRWAPPLSVSVNLSPLQVQNAAFPAEVAAVLEEYGLPAERLELEVTEGVMIRDSDAALATLRELKALGVSIAMDDFGTGYSSLRYFRIFPFDKVKIDQSFVRDMGSSPEALAIVQAVIGLARGLGLPVVAEGVESQDQMGLLVKEGCTQVQGYLLGRPAPIEAYLGSALEGRGGGSGSESRAA